MKGYPMDGIDFERIWNSPLMTPREAAKVLKVCDKTLRNLTQPRGPIPAVRISRTVIRYVPSELQAWIQSKLAGPSSVA